MSRIKGYTLIELLLSVALMGLLSAISLPVFNNFIFKNELDSASNITVRALRSAQTFSQGVLGDSQWGVAILAGNIVVFKGTTYASRDTNYDIIYTFPSKVAISGMSEIVYSKFYGIPSSTGTLNLSDSSNFRSVTINAKGTLTY